MRKVIFIIFILLIIFITGCVDISAAIQLCAEKELQYTGKIFGSDIECVNTTSGQMFRYSGLKKYEVKP